MVGCGEGRKGGGGGGLWNRERSQSSLGIDADLTPINVVVNIFLNILFLPQVRLTLFFIEMFYKVTLQYNPASHKGHF